MGTREVTSKESGTAQRRIIFLLTVYVHLVTSQRSDEEATAVGSPFPPSPPPLQYSSLNSCPNNLITLIVDAIICAPSSVAPPPLSHDGEDLHRVLDMMGDRKLRTAVVLAILTSRKDEGTQSEILFILIFPSAVWALFFCETHLRNICPRLAQVLEQLLGIFVVNGLMAFLLPEEWFWVPALCFGSSLLTLVRSPCLP